MCGIAGFIDRRRSMPDVELSAVASRMSATLRHRGPDSSGVWTDAEQGVALGHTRLSIVDLSECGAQPMHSACGRYCVTYNGEIYNHGELRPELLARGHSFRGHSDTEVLLAAIVEWGVAAAVRRCNGMFAFAVWDRRERALTLVRDRLGIKPLYYGWMGMTFLFGSELKPLRAHPAFQSDIDRHALALFLRHNYVPAPHSIYRGISKLPPGTLLVLAPDQPPGAESPERYWSLDEVVAAGARQPFTGGPEDAVRELDQRVRKAVRLQMEADVPLGAFLSGGIDSSTVVAAMQAQSSRPVKTFSIGFEEQRFNEAGYARAVAAHLGNEHFEAFATPRDALEVIPRLPALYDEPFADSSQVPTFLVSQMTRQHVTVSLSGEGGDESFGGYERYFLALRLWSKLAWLPAAAHSPLAKVLQWTAGDGKSGTLQRKMRTLASLLAIPDALGMYQVLQTHWRDAESIVVGLGTQPPAKGKGGDWPGRDSFLEQMMALDTTTYLPDDILVKVDRASMGVSLEARVPLLDHELVEFAWTLPPELKVRDGQAKWPLKRVLEQYVPRTLFERPKVGFGVPIEAWLRGPLRDWAETLLDERRLAREGYLQPEPIRQKWQAHVSGAGEWHYQLWDVLMFQSWLEAAAA